MFETIQPLGKEHILTSLLLGSTREQRHPREPIAIWHLLANANLVLSAPPYTIERGGKRWILKITTCRRITSFFYGKRSETLRSRHSALLSRFEQFPLSGTGFSRSLSARASLRFYNAETV
jgi:hypothetical protein